MIEIPGRIPVLIHPLFWLFAGLIGWLIGGSLWGMLIWVGIIFFSVLFHEYGHALTAVFFKQEAKIQLIALGGVTTFQGPKLKFYQQFLITLNGPIFGFILFLIATALLQLSLAPLLYKILRLTQVANLFWTVVNLLPVLPLDGGQLMRIVLEATFGVRGFKAALLIGTFFAVAIALYFFMIQAFLAGAFFFLFAFQSFISYRQSRYATGDDRDDSNKALMMQAERALQEGNQEEAKRLFEEIREKAGKGIIAIAASQYLAFILYKQGEKKRSYEILLDIKEQISDDLIPILHELAAEEGNDSLVIELSAKSYQIAPSQKMALANARAFARIEDGKAAGGWLQTAWQFGNLDLASILKEDAFEKIKTNVDFQKFIDEL